tara:strand:+ start:60 stop:581 length:522 start_codon:yes stop_codon:yes gene_type:complete
MEDFVTTIEQQEKWEKLYDEYRLKIKKKETEERKKRLYKLHRELFVEKKIKEYREEQKLKLIKKETEARLKREKKLQREIKKQIAEKNKQIINENRKTYIMKCNNTGFYKIGYSKSPKKREKTLQSEVPSIDLIKVWSYDIEKKLHNLYKEFRVRGEWFNLSKIQVKYICKHF